TRYLEVVVPARAWRFESSPAHQLQKEGMYLCPPFVIDEEDSNQESVRKPGGFLWRNSQTERFVGARQRRATSSFLSLWSAVVHRSS
ncbi:MAG: hypothetical protein KGJ01_03015, partial [Patescibacteria group bacterium]|nr:hypothetical protein [Patescibacteria group bacterium]